MSLRYHCVIFWQRVFLTVLIRITISKIRIYGRWNFYQFLCIWIKIIRAYLKEEICITGYFIAYKLGIWWTNHSCTRRYTSMSCLCFMCLFFQYRTQQQFLQCKLKTNGYNMLCLPCISSLISNHIFGTWAISVLIEISYKDREMWFSLQNIIIK